MGQGFGLFVSERSPLILLVRLRRVFQFLPGMLVSRQVILFAMLLLGGKMSMRATLMQFGGTLVVLVVRSVVETFGHN